MMRLPHITGSPATQIWTVMWSLLITWLTLTTTGSATYIGWKSEENRIHEKSNHINPSKRYGPVFKSDKDVNKYLKLYGDEMMLWRCKNAIQPYWDWKPIPVLELYCEAIGRLKNITWLHNGQPLSTGFGSHYGQVIKPHFSNGRWFAKWLDFRLRIYNATQEDSGIYTFRAMGPSGSIEEQTIYVDISEKKKKKKKKKKRTEEERALRRKLRKERRLKLRLQFWKNNYSPV